MKCTVAIGGGATVMSNWLLCAVYSPSVPSSISPVIDPFQLGVGVTVIMLSWIVWVALTRFCIIYSNVSLSMSVKNGAALTTMNESCGTV